MQAGPQDGNGEGSGRKEGHPV